MNSWPSITASLIPERLPAMSIRSMSRKALLKGLFLCLLTLLPAGLVSAAKAVSSAHPLATRAGMQILQQGGNAFDAAVAVSAVLGVVEPYGSGIGGGGFWLLHQAAANRQVMIDGRETAPLAAHRDMYLDAAGKPVPGLSINGPLAAGIPGQPAALVHLSEQYGQLPLATTLQPAIDLARNGFEVDAVYRRMAGWRLGVLQSNPDAAAIFLDNGELPGEGYRVVQTDLANTLESLAREGMDGFYRGEVAQSMVDSVRQAGGIWSLEDLAQYRVVEREPIVFSYHQQRITAAALPSSGGIVLALMLNMLAEHPLQQMTTLQRQHLLVEMMRRAYRERADYLGDSDFVEVPVKHLTSQQHARYLASDFDPEKASSNDSLVTRQKGMDTTHFSIVDEHGNRVAATLSINYPFGSGFVAAGTGVLLNDEMDDFSSSPGVPNVYGLVGSEANAIAPGKRMLSSMTPTFVEDGQGIAILGTPGGSRIITMVLLAILEMQQNRDPQHWVSLPRFHHQYLPDKIEFEAQAISPENQQALQEMGHRLQEVSYDYGNMQAIYIDKVTGQVSAASDPRGIGLSLVK